MLPAPTFQVRKKLDQFFSEHSIRPKMIGEIQDLSTQKIMAKKGLCLIAAPEIAVTKFFEENELIEIGRPQNLKDEYFLISTPDRIRHPLCQNLMKSSGVSLS